MQWKPLYRGFFYEFLCQRMFSLSSSGKKPDSTKFQYQNQAFCFINHPKSLIDQAKSLNDHLICLNDHPKSLVNQAKSLNDHPICLVNHPKSLVDEAKSVVDEVICFIDEVNRVMNEGFRDYLVFNYIFGFWKLLI